MRCFRLKISKTTQFCKTTHVCALLFDRRRVNFVSAIITTIFYELQEIHKYYSAYIGYAVSTGLPVIPTKKRICSCPSVLFRNIVLRYEKRLRPTT